MHAGQFNQLRGLAEKQHQLFDIILISNNYKINQRGCFFEQEIEVM